MTERDDLMRRAHAWVQYRPDHGDRFDMGVHIGRGRAVVGQLIDRVDELELDLKEQRSESDSRWREVQARD